MKKLLLVALLMPVIPAMAQLSQEYTAYISTADSLYNAKQYQASADAYTKAFASSGGKGLVNDRYDAACAWALAGNKDSAFFQLDRIATRANYTDYGHLTTDPDLASLHNDNQWKQICDVVKANKDKEEINFNKPVVATLDSVYIEDQQYRMQLEGTEAKYGAHSKEVEDLWTVINKKDSINLIRVAQIIDKYGWMGPDEIGNHGNQTLFLVIQHSDLKVQEKYLPQMREAVKNHKAAPSALALLEDRVALGEGKKQVYGSQIGRGNKGNYYISPLEDPDNVDRRREEVGLQPLAQYVQQWHITWNAEEYKKELPAIEETEHPSLKK